MAKVQGPLMSVSASGSVANAATHRATKHGAVVQQKSKPTGPASEAQQRERLRFANAMHQWDQLTTEQRAPWVLLATTHPLDDYKIFVREYLLQQCVPPNLPLVPAAPGA